MFEPARSLERSGFWQVRTFRQEFGLARKKAALKFSAKQVSYTFPQHIKEKLMMPREITEAGKGGKYFLDNY